MDIEYLMLKGRRLKLLSLYDQHVHCIDLASVVQICINPKTYIVTQSLYLLQALLTITVAAITVYVTMAEIVVGNMHVVVKQSSL